MIARQYGFASWPRLRRHVEVVTRYARSPHRAPTAAPATTGQARADPNAGYLWEGTYAFTALTGALGEGEDAANQRISALHQAASTGDLVMAELLLSLGADPRQRDRSFDSTPLGWARHGHHQQVIDRPAPVTEPGPASRPAP